MWPCMCHFLWHMEQLAIALLTWPCVTISVTLLSADVWGGLDQGWTIRKYTDSLSHWGQLTQIPVGGLVIIVSDYGLLSARHQAIIWTKDDYFYQFDFQGYISMKF